MTLFVSTIAHTGHAGAQSVTWRMGDCESLIARGAYNREIRQLRTTSRLRLLPTLGGAALLGTF